jgi:hypothetical protein
MARKTADEGVVSRLAGRGEDAMTRLMDELGRNSVVTDALARAMAAEREQLLAISDAADANDPRAAREATVALLRGSPALSRARRRLERETR